MSKKQKHSKKNNNYFTQQKNFGDWTNILEPPITFAEILTKITVSPKTPDSFLAEFSAKYPEVRAIVVQQTGR